MGLGAWRGVASVWCVSALLAVLAYSARASASPELTLSGAKAAGFSFDAVDQQFTHHFRLVAQNGEDVQHPIVQIADFQNGQGKEFPTLVSWAVDAGPPARVSLDAPAEFTVSAELPEPGTYETQLDLVYARRRTSIPLRVVRIPPAAAEEPKAMPVELVGPTVVQDTRPDAVTLRFTLRNLAHHEQSLSGPVLSSFGRKSAGGELLEWEKPAFVCGPSGEVVLPADAEGGVECGVPDERAGRYEGVLRLTEVGRKPLDVPFALSIRDHWLLAALFIALGVVASYLLREYFQHRRLWSCWQRDLARISERHSALLAGGPLSPRLARLAGECQREQEELRGALEQRRTDDFDKRIARAEARVALGVDVAAIEARIAKVPATERTALLAALDDAVDAACTAELDATAVGKSLSQIGVASAERAALARLIAQTREDVDANIAALGDTLAAQLEGSVVTRVVEATNALANDQVEVAREALLGARLELARAVAGALRSELAGQRPEVVDTAEWSRLGADLSPPLQSIASMTDPDLAADTYSRVLQRYATALVDTLLAALRRRQREINATAPDDKTKERIGRDFADMIARAAPAKDATPAEKLRAFRAVAAEFGANYAKAAARQEREVSARAPAAAPLPAKWREIAASEAEVAPFVPSRVMQRRIESQDMAVTAVLLVVSILLGIKVLWIGDPTWGGPESYLVAFLWGVGLHAIGNLSLAGVAGLKEQLSKAQ